MEVDVEFDVTADHNIAIGVAYESDHLHLNATDATSVSINVVALFFLLGLFFCTRIYRRRGRLCDKLFFAMIITNVMMAVSDAMIGLLNQSAVSFAGPLIRFSGTVLFIGLSVELVLLVLFLMSLLEGGEKLVSKYYRFISVPAVAMIVMMIINVFGEFIFSVDPRAGKFTFDDLYNTYYVEGTTFTFYEDTGVGAYNHAGLYFLIFIEAAIYILIAVAMLWMKSKVGILMFAANFAVWLYMKMTVPEISLVPFICTIIILYMLVLTMNQSFHVTEEEG